MKTIKEQGREYAKGKLLERGAKGFSDREFNGCDIGLAYMDGIKAATRWIPLEDRNVRMPDLKECLLLDENGKVWTDDEFTEKRPMVIITHWLPIPQL